MSDAFIYFPCQKFIDFIPMLSEHEAAEKSVKQLITLHATKAH